MTTAITRDPRFGQITGFAGPNASPLVALCGRKVLIAEKSGDRVSLLGQSPDLGGTVLAADNSTAGEIHILTSAGYVRTDDADTPAVLSVLSFDPGNGKWLFRYGNYLVAPCVDGGVQAFHKTTGTIVNKIRTGLSSSRFGAGNSSLGYLWVVDETRAKIAGYTVSSTGILTFAGTVNAPNCRNVIKVVVDATQGNLFVVCKNRVVRFTIPTTAVGIDSMLPVFAEDYGTRQVKYTDFVVVAPDSYWIGREKQDVAYPLAYDFGPVFGVWDASLGDNGELLVAAPKMSVWNVTNVVPTYDTEDAGGPPDPSPIITDPEPPPPEVILPDPPVITSSDTATVTEGELWAYTITATGTGPITYSIVSKPSWLTPAGTLSGYFSGTQFTVGTYEITVSATNAGGTTTQVVTLTVIAALYEDLTAISTNGQVRAYSKAANLVYFVGSFTTVTDRNGTYTRNRAACLDMSTGLWTAWHPDCSTTMKNVHVDGNNVYLMCQSASHTVGGQSRGWMSKVDTAGTVQSFNPTFNNGPTAMVASGGTLYVVGSFDTVNSQTRWAACAFNGDTLSGWDLRDSGSGNRVAAWNGLGFPGQIHAVAVAGGVLCYTGVFQIAHPTSGSLQWSYGQANLSTGQPAQMSRGTQVSNTNGTVGYCGVERDGVFRWPQSIPDTLSARSLPTGTPTYYTSKSFGAMSGSGALDNISETLDPTFSGGSNLYFFSKLNNGKYLIGGLWTTVNGDSARRNAVVLDASGNIDTGFTYVTRGNAAWQAGIGSNYPQFGRIESFGGQEVAIWLGTFGNISAQTYDGAPVANLMFLNPETGARL